MNVVESFIFSLTILGMTIYFSYGLSCYKGNNPMTKEDDCLTCGMEIENFQFDDINFVSHNRFCGNETCAKKFRINTLKKEIWCCNYEDFCNYFGGSKQLSVSYMVVAFCAILSVIPALLGLT